MTGEELCQKFGVSKSALSSHFKRVQDTIKKKYGVDILKEGRGASAQYIIKGEEDNSIKQSIAFIQDAHRDVVMDRECLGSLIDWDFMVFIGIITCPLMVFRGTYSQFLDYVGIQSKSEQNILRLKESFAALKESGYIDYVLDNSTKEDYFVSFIKRKTETDMKVGIDMIQRCMKLQKENRMTSWVPLLKTWLGLQLIAVDDKRKNFTMKELEMLTGVNKKMLTKCKGILEGDNLFQTSKAYTTGCCIGQNIDMNGLEHDYNRE